MTIESKIGEVLATYAFSAPPTQPSAIQLSPDRYQTYVLLAQTIVLLAQTVLLSMIAIWTFRRGAQLRVLERRAAWYQKAVIDHVLPALATFFQTQTELLSAAAETCTELRQAQNGTALENLVKEVVADFKKELYPTQGLLADRTAVFDGAFGASIRESFDLLEERVTEWFDVHAFSHSRQNEKTLRDLLSESETEIVKKLYDFEFSQFG